MSHGRSPPSGGCSVGGRRQPRVDIAAVHEPEEDIALHERAVIEAAGEQLRDGGLPGAGWTGDDEKFGHDRIVAGMMIAGEGSTSRASRKRPAPAGRPAFRESRGGRI